ncbi:MAG: 16S rRNA processing protein RimM [Candidatus Firestonebacteria bacterium]|nr:16S rRNA processing protein RimM [Candidatus Firestonebacteria bacterium]
MHGEIKLFPLSDVPGRFEALHEVWWQGVSGANRKLRLQSVRSMSTFYLARFEGLDTPEAVAELARGYVVVPESQRGKLPAGSYFVDDIVGLAVEDEGGQPLGRVTGVYQTGANDIYEIVGSGGELLLPALKDLVLEINLEAKRMRVRVPEGLQA